MQPNSSGTELLKRTTLSVSPVIHVVFHVNLVLLYLGPATMQRHPGCCQTTPGRQDDADEVEQRLEDCMFCVGSLSSGSHRDMA